MGIVMYYSPRSAPCRPVLLLAKTLGIEIDFKTVQTRKGDTKTPEFLKMNPQHCVPTITDDGFVLWESRAILGYLVDKYATDDSLYPKNPEKRAVVNQRLYFDIGTLFHGYVGYYGSVLRTCKLGDPAFLNKIEEAFQLLDKFLEEQNWIAGNNITIADYSIIVTVSNLDAIGFDIHRWKNVSEWHKKSQVEIDGYDEVIGAGCEIFKQMYYERLQQTDSTKL